MWTRAARTPVLCALALAVMAAPAVTAVRADDTPAAQDPDPGFLEFLGGVDRLAEVNPDYLTDPPPAKAATQPPRAAPAGPSAPPRQDAPDTPGAKNNG